MYDNIGGKIKGLAKATFIVEAIAAVITGIAFMATDEDMIPVGWLVAVVGSIVAWVSSWLLYGYGQLIENSDIIAEEYNRKNKTHQNTVTKNNERKQNQRRKEVNSIIASPDVADDEFVDFTCPHCQAELYYTKEQLQKPDGLTCPMCDSPISL